jgi:hypothetical protein
MEKRLLISGQAQMEQRQSSTSRRQTAYLWETEARIFARKRVY